MKGGSFFGLGKSPAPKVKSEKEQAEEFAAYRFSTSPELANQTGEETGKRGARDLVQGLMGKTGTMEERYEALKTEWAGMKRGNTWKGLYGGKKSRKSRKSRKTKGGKKSKKSKKSKKTRKTRRKSRKH
tara:strand:+ start:56 stop:442 length:387 start_codon:yes stop_codon:yes gene_type:complete